MTEKEKLHASRIWWKRLSLEYKFYKVIKWLHDQGKDTTEKHPDDLTESEVLEIWMMQKL